MRILLASDLHDDAGSREWLRARSADCDMIALGGDLLNGLEQREGLAEQFERLRDWLDALPCPVALCCGNHDDNGTGWFDFLRSERVLTSGESRVFHGLVVTAIPWRCDGSELRDLMTQGRTLRTRNRCPWLVLHHAPVSENPRLQEHVEMDNPTVVLTGHIHDRPFIRDAGPVLSTGLTREVFPGRRSGLETACLWDTDGGRIEWIQAG